MGFRVIEPAEEPTARTFRVLEPPPKPKGVVGRAVSAATGAARDVRDDFNRQRETARSGKAAPLVGEGSSINLLGRALAVPLAPVSSVISDTIVNPLADVLTEIPMKAYAAPKSPTSGIGQPLTKEQTREAWREDVNTALMAAAPAPASAIPRAPRGPRPNVLAEGVAQFERSNVTPNLAAIKGGGTARVANAVAENPVGFRARSALAGQQAEAGAEARRIAGRYGAPRGPQITGENVQAGVERFANSRKVTPASRSAPAGQSSFSAKAGTLYDDAFAAIPDQPVTPAAATTALKDITTRVSAPTLSEAMKNPQMSRIAEALAQDSGKVTFSDLRSLRTWVRNARKTPELRASLGEADLAKLEGALTKDIMASAETLGGPQAAHKLRRADQFYAAGSQRIQNALKPFDNAKSGESAYSRLVQAAGSNSSADAQQLLSLKRSLTGDEWGDIAANVVNELGKPTKAAVGAMEPEAFSVSTFVSNYNGLSPRARQVMFGSVGGGGGKASNLRAELDNLARVVDKLKAVEKGANASNTGTALQQIGTYAALFNPATTIPTAKVLAGLTLSGEVLTNPVAVRWLARIGSAKSPQMLNVTVKQLGNAARTNAALMPLYQEVRLSLEAPKAAISVAASPETTEQQ